MNAIDANFPVCAQCAVTCTVEEYLCKALPNLLRVKYSFFGNECIVMHGHKIRKKTGPFHILKHDEVFDEFMKAISWCFKEMDGCLVVAAVDKLKHKAKYIWPDDPLYLSLQFLLERLHDHWRPKLVGGKRLLCVFEKRGDEEDKVTKAHFDKICAGANYRHRVFPFDSDFRPKDNNVAGHQYADLAAYAACRFVETGNEERKDWQTVRAKLRTVGGEFLGHGLKIFPPQ